MAAFSAADTAGASEFNRAVELYFSGNYSEALSLFKKLVTQYAEFNIGRQALAFEGRVLRKIERANDIVPTMLTVAETYAGKEIVGLAKSIIVGEKVKNGAYQDAANLAASILAEYPNSDYEKYALYDLATINWYYLQDKETGESFYRQLITRYPDDALAESALATLGEWQAGDNSKPQARLADGGEIPKEFAVSPNYPNPFNPATQIRYALPQAGKVTLRIYNLLGDEVRIFDEGEREAGRYRLTWDGKDSRGHNVASGVYLYRLIFTPSTHPAQRQVRSGKMSLLQ